MYTLKVENTRGQTLTLTQNEGRFQIVNIDGLNQPNAIVNTSTMAGMDGSKFASTKLQERNIVLTVRLNGHVEANRLLMYKYFGTKQWCKLYFKNGARDVYTEGYVETTEAGLFQNGQTMQISIVCPDPYFKSLRAIITDISQVLGQFTFPFSFGALGILEETITDDAREFSIYVKDRIATVMNEGEGDTGVTIEITATGEVVNPTIYNVDTRESFGLNLTLVKGDVIIINTNSGQKSVRRIRDAVDTNQVNKIVKNSTWLSLIPGDNLFTYDADSGTEEMNIVFKHRTNYKGV